MDNSTRFLLVVCGVAVLLGIVSFIFLVFPIPQITQANKEAQVIAEIKKLQAESENRLAQAKEIEQRKIVYNNEIKSRYTYRLSRMITGNGGFNRDYYSSNQFSASLYNGSDCFVKKITVDFEGFRSGKKVKSTYSMDVNLAPKSSGESSVDTLARHVPTSKFTWSFNVKNFNDPDSDTTYFCAAPEPERNELQKSLEEIR